MFAIGLSIGGGCDYSSQLEIFARLDIELHPTPGHGSSVTGRCVSFGREPHFKFLPGFWRQSMLYMLRLKYSSHYHNHHACCFITAHHASQQASQSPCAGPRQSSSSTSPKYPRSLSPCPSPSDQAAQPHIPHVERRMLRPRLSR